MSKDSKDTNIPMLEKWARVFDKRLEVNNIIVNIIYSIRLELLLAGVTHIKPPKPLPPKIQII